jgi:replication-associated recombination protein RarA
MNILGQDNVKRFLESRISNLPTTMLFCGPEGSGKASAARELAKEINYQVYEIYPDEDSYKVRQIRELLKAYRESHKAVFIINDVDLLSGPAASILLKTLEDPKDEVIFILTAKEYAQVSYTIYSRCVMLEFNAVDEGVIKEYLQHKYNVWNEHFSKIANGSFKMADEVASGDYLSARNLVWSFLSEIKFINEDSLNVPDFLREEPAQFLAIALNLLYDIAKVDREELDTVVNTDIIDEYRNWLDRYNIDYAIFAMICFRDLAKIINEWYNKDLHLKTLLLKLKLGSVPL